MNFRNYFNVLFWCVIICSLCVQITHASTREMAVVGVLENWPPQYGLDKKTGKPEGLAIDVMSEIADISQLNLRYKTFQTWPELHQALKNGEIDIIPNMGITNDRLQFFDYTEPYETTNIRYYIRKRSNDIKSVKDLAGKIASVVETNKGRALMEEKSWEKLKIHKSLEEAILSVLSGSSDFLVYPDPPLNKILQELGLDERIIPIGEPLLEIKRGIAVRKDNMVLIQHLDSAVHVFLTTGRYRAIYSKYYENNKEVHINKETIPIFIIILVTLIILLLLWRYLSIRRIAGELRIAIEESNANKEILLKNQYYLVKSQELGKIGTWELNILENELIWTDENYRIFGVVLGKKMTYESFLEVVHPEDREAVNSEWEAALRGNSYDIEHRLLLKDSIKWVREKADIEFAPDGTAIKAIGFTQDISDHVRSEEALRQSEESLKDAQKVSHVGSWTWYINTNQLEWSDEMYRIFAIDKDSFTGNLEEVISGRIHPDDREVVESSNTSVIEEKTPIPVEYRIIWPDGSVRTVWAEAGRLRLDDFGEPEALTGIVQDITSRKKNEDRIKASLKEKETLLHEIHHRVKNNMQIIASILRLQLNSQKRKGIDDTLRDNIGRVFAMATIHESLHQSDMLSEINFKPYLNRLAKILTQTYAVDPVKVSIQIDAPDLKLNIDVANPLGLVVNELISNSLKYAFQSEKAGVIMIIAKYNSNIDMELSIADDGIGFPDNLDWKACDSLGLRLVRDIVERQLDGSIELAKSESGAKFIIRLTLEPRYQT